MMNEQIQNILDRRAVRSYKPDPVPKELLEEVITAGLYAASGMGKQSPVFVAITDKETRDNLASANTLGNSAFGDPFYGAPAVIVVLANKEAMTYVYDGALAMGNMMQAASQLGLSTCWIHRAKEVFEMPEWKEWLKNLGLEGEYEGIGNLIIGYGAGEKPVAKPRKDGRVFWVE